MVRTRKQRKQKKQRTKRVYRKNDFKSGDGMLTAVWGPSLWHYLHTMSFNYPIKPTKRVKCKYRRFIQGLVHVLPCKYCRDNLKNNLKTLPLREKDLTSRHSFSRWMFKMHELVNKMLGKSSGLKYCDIRERYEHFRARCTNDITKKIVKIDLYKGKTRKKRTRVIKKRSKKGGEKSEKKEKGCSEPLYGKKSKCVIKIVPKDKKCDTFQMDKRCIKKRHK